MARRSRKDSLETRERLLDAALELFHVRGVSRPSLSDIASIAGVTRGAVYVHFENKGDLFTAMLDRTMLPADALSAWNPDAGTPLQRLHASFVFLMRETATNPKWRCVLQVVFHKCEKLEENGAILARLSRGRRDTIDMMKRLVHDAIAQGELPDDLDVDTAIPFLHSCVMGVISQWLLHGDLDLAAHAAPFADGLIEMLRTSTALRVAPRVATG